MSQITFYNMGFGDSFLIENGRESLLVDCGTYYDPLSLTTFSTYAISLDLSKIDRKYLMITHYHEDHFNKILDVCNHGHRFNVIYVRNLGKRYFSFDFYSMFVELTKYAKRTGDYKTYVTWLSKGILRNLIARGGTVIGLNSDIFKSFRVGNLKANVLWPTSNLPTQTCQRMLDSAEKIEGIIKENASSRVLQHIKNTKEFFKRVYATIGSESNEETIDNLYHESLDSPILTEEEAKELVESIDPLLEGVKSELLNLENYLSIVFEMDGGLLMCGDATKTAMKNALTNSSLTDSPDYNYKIVKVPHHGTEPYFFNSYYDSSTCLLIPNSFQIRTASWGIYGGYSYPNTSNCHCLNNSPTSACKSSCHCSAYSTLLFKRIVF